MPVIASWLHDPFDTLREAGSLAPMSTDADNHVELLVQGVLSGDPEAEGALFSDHVRPHLRRRPGGQDEDLVQEVCILVLRGLRDGFQFRSEPAFYAWLNMIQRRAQSRRVSRPEPELDSDEPDSLGMADGPDPISQSAHRETVDRAFALLAELPTDLREAVVRYDLQGETFDSIARSIGVTEGLIRQRRAKGLSRLAHRMAPTGEA